jgi:hypothetical protein
MAGRAKRTLGKLASLPSTNTGLPNGASIALVGFLNLINSVTSAGTPTCNASGSCAARSNALSHFAGHGARAEPLFAPDVK